MIYIILFVSLMMIFQSYRVSLRYLRKEFNKLGLIEESILFFIMLILIYFLYKYENIYITIITLILSIYVLIMFIYELVNRSTDISVLSIKDSIDMSTSGILFLNNKNEYLLINNVMSNILNILDIKEDYINNLKNNCFKTLKYSSLLRVNNNVYQLIINGDKEILLLDITDIYKLQEVEEKQNKKIEKNNKKILNTINNIENIEKEINLLKIKNEYHDLLGYKLAIFSKYMEQDNIKKEDIEYLLDNINESNYIKSNNITKINELIKIYNIIGISINIEGNLPKNDHVVGVLFEIFREAITNAVIHANCKNIYINILDNIITISNDGTNIKGKIHEHEGIRGMRRKLKSINGTLVVDNSSVFKLIIKLK